MKGMYLPFRVAKVGVFPSSSGKRMIPLRIWVVPLPKISPHVTTALDIYCQWTSDQGRGIRTFCTYSPIQKEKHSISIFTILPTSPPSHPSTQTPALSHPPQLILILREKALYPTLVSLLLHTISSLQRPLKFQANWPQQSSDTAASAPADFRDLRLEEVTKPPPRSDNAAKHWQKPNNLKNPENHWKLQICVSFFCVCDVCVCFSSHNKVKRQTLYCQRSSKYK